MKKFMVVLLVMTATWCLTGCSNTGDQDDPQSDDVNLVTNSLDATNQPGREISDFNPEEWDVILRDSDNWYVLLNHVATRSGRTFTYSGSVFIQSGSQDYTDDAWMTYDEVTHSLSIGCISPFTADDILLYTMVYDENAGNPYDFNGSYGWRTYPYGNHISMLLQQGTLGTITADAKTTGFEVKEAQMKSTVPVD